MRISAKSEYACLALLAMARLKPDDPPLRTREISESHGIPERYLVQILLQRKGSGLVVSTRGASGGYRLGKPPDTISVGEILNAVDGPEGPRKEPETPASRVLAVVWEHVRAAEREILDRTTLAQLAKESGPHEWFI